MRKIMRYIILLALVALLLGVVSAQPLPAKLGWNITTVDSGGNVGSYSSLALDDEGYPHISYFDADPNFDLKYAVWNGSAWSNETVDSGGPVGGYISLALDDEGYPHISYYDYWNNILKYAAWNGSAWSIETVDNVGVVGLYTSLALNASDYPHISYYDSLISALKYAAWNGSAWSIETVNSGGNVGTYTSLALDDKGYPHIRYYDSSNSTLKYAAWNGSAWSIETVDSEWNVGYYTSLALDDEGYPHISYLDYWNNILKYAMWNGSAWSIETVDSDGNVGEYTSLALDTSGTPHISYYDWTNFDLKYAVQGPVPDSTFSAAPTSGTAPLNVTFTDESTGSPPSSQWMWLFGDGGTSTGQHPDHTFTAPGTYSVTLTATNRFGSDTAVMEDYITVLAPPRRDGGGGGRSTTAVAVVEEGLNAGENATFSFDESAIYRIVVTAETDIPDIMITASKATLPASIPAPNGTVFEYAELTPYKVTDDAIAGTLIEFTVPLSWLENNGFDPSQVMLIRWHDGEWQELPTEIVKEENGKVYFRAESPGLSLFAIIAGEKVALDDGEEPTEAPTAEPTSSPAALPEETESPAMIPTPTPQETPLLWAPLLALGAFLFFRKRE
jgi:PGF-pre-PGF domain-containing protein